MAEEPVEPEVVEPAVEPVEPAVEPHPLAEGGARFNEVYARMKQAEERAARAEAERAALLVQQRPMQPQQPVVYTADQLQAFVDQGRITPMQAADYISRQHAQAAAMQTTTAAIQIQQLNAKMQMAADEVNTFIAKMPSLRDTNSAEFQKVSQVAYQTAEDMGLPVTDFRVQRAALRQVYGSVERIASNGAARQQSREASLPHTETSVGSTGRTNVKADDALKGVDQQYIDFWTKKGYSRERMIEEAKYVTKVPRRHAAHQR